MTEVSQLFTTQRIKSNQLNWDCCIQSKASLKGKSVDIANSVVLKTGKLQ